MNIRCFEQDLGFREIERIADMLKEYCNNYKDKYGYLLKMGYDKGLDYPYIITDNYSKRLWYNGRKFTNSIEELLNE